MAHTGALWFKVVLSGEFGVGKSSIFRRFVNNTYVETSDAENRSTCRQNDRCPSVTCPLDTYTRMTSAGGRPVQLELWDTAGMERFRTLSANYYANASAVIVCYALDSRDSFTAAADYVVEAVENVGRTASTGSLVFLCGNKSDVTARSHGVTLDDVNKLLAEYDHVICQSFIVSCKEGQGVEEMFDDIAVVLRKTACEKAERTRRILLNNSDYQWGKASSKPLFDSCNCSS